MSKVRLTALEFDFQWARSEGEGIIRRKANVGIAVDPQFATHDGGALRDGNVALIDGTRRGKGEQAEEECNWSDHFKRIRWR